MTEQAQQIVPFDDTVDEKLVQERNQRIRAYLVQQRNEILERLQEQGYEILNLRKNRYTYCIDDLEEGLTMYHKGVKGVLQAYFPLVLDDKHWSLLCQGYTHHPLRQISAKVMQLRSVIDKNWSLLCKQLIRAKEEVDLKSRKIKREERPAVRKGPNCKIPVESTCILQKWLLQNFSDPYPSNAKKAQMARQSSLSIYQVNNWFINARERIVKKFHKKEGSRLTRQLIN